MKDASDLEHPHGLASATERSFRRGTDSRITNRDQRHIAGYGTRRKGLRAGSDRASCSLPGHLDGASDGWTIRARSV
jgi:hypothetical protein